MMTLNKQGSEIVAAIKAGFAAGGADEWDSPEFEAARNASETAGCVWDFLGWYDTLRCILRHGALGGTALTIDVSIPDHPRSVRTFGA